MGQFEFNNEVALIGVLSDGCTGEIDLIQKYDRDFYKSKHKTQYGARWLVTEFVKSVKHLLVESGFQKDILRSALYYTVERMRWYKPHNINDNNNEFISKELYATLYAYIVTAQKSSIIMAGTGSILINNQYFDIYPIYGDIYPAHLHGLPASSWKHAIAGLFPVVTIPTHSFYRLALCSDGLCHHSKNYLKDNIDIISAIKMISFLNECHKTRDRESLKPWKKSIRFKYDRKKLLYMYHNHGDDDMSCLVVDNPDWTQHEGFNKICKMLENRISEIKPHKYFNKI